jgi:hypothetical protein
MIVVHGIGILVLFGRGLIGASYLLDEGTLPDEFELLEGLRELLGDLIQLSLRLGESRGSDHIVKFDYV